VVVRCEYCVLSGRGCCDGLITRPEESYRLWCVLVCDIGTSRMSRLKLIKGCKCRIEEEYSLARCYLSRADKHLTNPIATLCLTVGYMTML
jgi:hypothetical protein